jgi:formylglycine-generating enzyme required for sulfatase activity
MKKNTFRTFLVLASLCIFAMQAVAQGIVVNKIDGTKVYYKAEEVSSIGVYGYGEEPEPEPEEPEGNVFTVNGVSFTMVAIEGGTFLMGSDGTDAYSDEKPVHQVKLSPFSIGQTEVTQELWEAVMGSNPSTRKGQKLPVEQVSWDDCQTFITKLNQLTGQQFRLPTEAEWEFAARGGNSSKVYKYSGSNNIGDVAWCSLNSGDRSHEVGTKQPNELRLYDMSGNVNEWCQDWYGSNYYSASVINNPTGPTTASTRVFRGGSWHDNASYGRVSYRGDFTPYYCLSILGLRLAL